MKKGTVGGAPVKLSSKNIIRLIKTGSGRFWSGLREKKALDLFHKAVRRVPAYKDFLRKNRISPEKIKNFSDFQFVPVTDKKNYLRQYPLKDLCWDGTLERPYVFTSTSGSTGEPFYFMRGERLDWESSLIHELFLLNSRRKKGPVLVIVGFGMGVWIGGLITYKAFEIASRGKDYPVSIITPGINKIEILNALKKLSPQFAETIIAGYPPFLKDIVDSAAEERINLKKLNVRLLFAAEPFTENFRDYVVKKAGVKNPNLDTLNVYGTAEIGTMAYETPTSIMMRRLAVKDKELFRDVFSNIEKTPTLAQYNPFFVNFEAPEGEILLTGDNSIPLVRYAVGDRGGVYGFDEASPIFKANGYDLEKESRKNSLKEIYKLPFVYVYERIDYSTTLYGLQIYPEAIREALLKKNLNGFFTGKFTMITKFDKHQDQFLEINLELKKSKKAEESLKKKALKEIIIMLRNKNSEFRELHSYLGKRAIPKLVFWEYEHPLFFKQGVKQKWVRKNYKK
ncbi:MAG: phenylacetate--CoA ligase family protein [Candidatus Liptonbacteria bacterium]|nr:phenylacetate--CoA ligase family protein [Candidatus Liptonbacteria bacterium]